MVDNANDSVYAFQRTVGDETLVFVFNMTTNYFEYFAIPLMQDGVYEEIFNSDKDVYGGANQYNGLPIESEPGSFEGCRLYFQENKVRRLFVCLKTNNHSKKNMLDVF